MQHRTHTEAFEVEIACDEEVKTVVGEREHQAEACKASGQCSREQQYEGCHCSGWVELESGNILWLGSNSP